MPPRSPQEPLPLYHIHPRAPRQQQRQQQQPSAPAAAQGRQGNASAVLPTAGFKRQQRTPLVLFPRRLPTPGVTPRSEAGISVPPAAQAPLDPGLRSPPSPPRPSQRGAPTYSSPTRSRGREGGGGEALTRPGHGSLRRLGLRGAALAAAGLSRQPKPGRSSPQGAPLPPSLFSSLREPGQSAPLSGAGAMGVFPKGPDRRVARGREGGQPRHRGLRAWAGTPASPALTDPLHLRGMDHWSPAMSSHSQESRASLTLLCPECFDALHANSPGGGFVIRPQKQFSPQLQSGEPAAGWVPALALCWGQEERLLPGRPPPERPLPLAGSIF